MGREGTFVKFCGMTRVEDAQQAVRLGASAVGFIFAPSPRRVELVEAADISSHLHPSIRKIGVFVDADVEEVANMVTTIGLDGVQLQGDEDDDFILELRSRLGELFVLKALRPEGLLPDSLRRYARADALLVDPKDPAKPEELSQPIDPGFLNGADMSKIVLAGGLTPENVAQTVAQLRPFGVDVSSGVEQSAGVKDHDRMKAFITAVRKAEGMSRHPSSR